MADILVTSPYRPFTLPSQFKAVFNGFIYCGTVDAVDPSNSQIQIYKVNEDGSKVPVAQPLRTNAGGYLVYNGQPAKFVTDSSHSLLVRDSLGAQVWYAPDVSILDPEAMYQSILERFAQADGSSLVGGLIKPVTAFLQASDGGDYSKAVTRGFLTEKALYFPNRADNTPWLCNTTFTIPSNCALILDRCDLKCNLYTNLINQVGITEFSLTANGVCRIIGPRIGTPGEAQSIGLNMVDCYRPTFGGNGALIFQDWSDRGWKASSTTFTGKAAFGLVFNVITRNNGVGWDLGDGDGCEYWSLSNLRSFSNMHGGYCQSPNSTFVNGGCTDNVINGLHHFTGFNDGHSSYANFNFNHNGTNNLYLLGINNGLAFSNCQIFDDGAGTDTGKIRIEGCKGVTINGGEINADVEVIGACSANTINSAYFTDDARAYDISGTGRSGLFVMRCSNPRGSGAFPLNDNTFAYTVGYVGAGQTGQIPVNVPTTLKVTEVTSKTIGSSIYDAPSGKWFARSAGKYAIDVYVDLGGSGAIGGNFFSIYVNGIITRYIPMQQISSGDVFGTAYVELENMSVGDNMEIKVNVSGGTLAPRTRSRVSMRMIA